MTQPETEAVDSGAETETVLLDAEPTIEERLSQAEAEQEDEEAPEEQLEPDTGEDEPDDGEGADEAAEAEEQPEETVAAPVSWTDEEKAQFAQLPPDVQKVISRREGEREKFVQSKSQEASKVAQQVQQQAIESINQLQNNYAQQLASLIPQVPEKPSAHLMATNPQAYAQQLEAFEQGTAQRDSIVQQLQQVASQQQQAQKQLEQQEKQQLIQSLQTQFPEYLSDAELRQSLGSTALELGYPAEMLAQANFQDIMAMKMAHDWKTKAAKYDALQNGKMEKVRAAKLPSVSRPGAAQPKGAAARERYTADRKAMRNGDTDAAARVFGRFV